MAWDPLDDLPGTLARVIAAVQHLVDRVRRP